MTDQVFQGFSLSPQQEHAWTLLETDGAGPYRVCCACRITGRLELARLEAALRETVLRHEILRTAFRCLPGMKVPLQVIRESAGLHLRHHDLRAFAADGLDQAVQTLVRETLERPLDLEAGEPLDGCLAALSGTEHLLVLTLPALCADGTTLANLVREIGRSYEGMGGEEEEDDEPLQYADVAQIFRQVLESEQAAEGRDYWRFQTAEPPLAATLPFERPPAGGDGFRPAMLETDIAVADSAEVVARELGATPAAFFFACWQLLLRRLTDRTDLPVAMVADGRRYEGLPEALGLFARSIPVPLPTRRGGRLSDLVRQVEQSFGTVRKWQDSFSWDLVPGGSGDGRDRYWPFCFEVAAAAEPFAAGGLSFAPEVLWECWHRFKLKLSLLQDASGWRARLAYDQAALDRSTVERVASGFQALLHACIETPDALVEELDFLGEAERRRLLFDFNDTRVDHGVEPVLHRLFEARVQEAPEALALVAGDLHLTRGELDRRADRLARRLRDDGVASGSLVAVYVERSAAMVISLLGVLKAGGAYIPLDPEYPEDRLRSMMEDAGAAVLVVAGGRPAGLENAAVTVEAELGGEEAGRPEVPAGPADPADAAYVIYTSGSTGRPKGVVVPHGAIANRLLWMRRVFPLRPSDRVLQKTPYGFDASVWELFSPLLEGACLVLAEPGAHRDTARLAELVVEQGITRIQFVPSLLGLFLDEPGIAGCGSLEHVFCGGEALLGEHRDRHFQRLGAGLCNLYGPTECSIDVSYHPCHPGEEGEREGVVPIGRPVDNMRTYLLGADLLPVPLGLAGALYAGGVGLARGYLHRPDLTAERFVPDPYSGERGERGGRLYATGDLARYRQDGALEYLGRTDQQVKIRGVRVEPGEVEGVLLEHPAVAEAVVVARREENGTQRLAAYVVPARGQEALAAAGLGGFLAARLPDAMVPAFFVVLDALPRLPNGKVDRGALPAPERAASSSQPYAAPRTPEEVLLAEIWSGLLGVDRVGIHDNFFELGGDSILSIQVVSRAKRAGLELTAQQLFTHQTVARLAAVAGVQAAPAVAAVEEIPAAGPLPLTPSQLWFLAQEPADPHHYNQAYLLATSRPLPREPLARALQALVRHHDALRLRFERTGEGWRQTLAEPAGEPPLAWVDLSALPASLRSAAITTVAAAAQASLDLERELVRAVYFDLGPGPHRLLLAIHHLAVDGFSWRVLMEDFDLAFGQASQGRPIELPAATTSFGTWARRLAEHARALPLEPELSWWRRQGQGDLAALPIDRDGGANTVASAAQVTVALSGEETRALLQEVPAAYRTQINDVLLTALAQSLGAPGRSLLVDLEGHGREEVLEGVDLSRTVGWFTSTYPVRLAAGPADDPGAALQQVKEHLRSVPRRGIGYGLLRYLREAETGDRLAELPRAEVSFNYLGQFDQVLPRTALLTAAREDAGPSQSPRARRSHVLEVVGLVADGCLRLSWIYSANLQDRATVEHLATSFVARLRALIGHCRAAVEARIGGYTPSDFPLAALRPEELATLLGEEWGIEDVYPLSPLQGGILFHTVASPGSAYLEQLVCVLHGDLDLEALRAACRQVIAAHPILRTSFHWRGVQRPVQVVHADAEEVLAVLDWRHSSRPEQDHLLAGLLRADREKGFDFARPPLMRWTLIRTGEQEHRLLWTQHHILLDAWSFSALTGDFLLAYEAARNGAEPVLPQRPPYRDYIAWVQRQDAAGTEEYWRRTLAGWTEPTPLGIRELAENGLHGSELCEARLTAEQTALLHALARRWQVTLNTLVQAAWGLLLARYSRLQDVVFGVTVSGRPPDLPGVESITGLFINTLPVRLATPWHERLLPWLHGLQASQAELRRHEHSALVDVQQWSDLPAVAVLFETIFVFENYPRDASLRQGGGSLGLIDVQAVEEGHYHLTVIAGPGAEMTLGIDYDRARFEAATIGRMAGHFRNLVLGLLAAADDEEARRLGDLPLLSADERRQVLVDWNDSVSAPPAACIHELIAEQARRTPLAAAVRMGERVLSYSGLIGQAGELAQRLRSLGVGPEVRVAVHFERAPEMVVGLLGVLAAGGAYVPLDPTYPRERLAAMLADCGAEVLLTQAELAAGLPHGNLPVLCLEAAGASARQAPLPPSGVDLDNPAYVIYTSGSTGRPKGVVIAHRTLADYASAVAGELGLGPADRFLQFASLSFDVAVEEIFPVLLAGGSVVLRDPLELASSDGLSKALTEEEVTVLELPTVFWHEWVYDMARTGTRPPACLRLLLMGGEPALPERVAAWHGLGTPMIHVFGLTEVTVTSLLYPVTQGEVGPPSGLPIGRPFGGNRAYVVDPGLREMPPAVAGELCLGGSCLARCYLDRPELTAMRFVPDPFSPEPGARLYRTGDLARHRADGNLEFLGRIDEQMKIRGFRIEPGEIEAALHRHPAVRDAVVVAREDGPGERSLVACLVPKEGAGVHGQGRGYDFGMATHAELWPSQGCYHIYDEVIYQAMTLDHRRNQSYMVAMRRLVKDRVVVDLGTGADIALSRMCIEAGARKIYAIELLEESYRKAGALIRELGLEDRITLVHGASTQLELPEKGDVLVSELIGCIGSSEGAIVILNDAWRFLKDDGVMIPERCATRIAAVRLPDHLARNPAFTEVSAYYTEKVFERVGYPFDLRLCIRDFPRDHVVSTSELFEDLVFTGPIPPDESREVSLTIEQDGTIDGFLLWVNLHTVGEELVDVLDYLGCWSPMYFPVFYPGVAVSAGDVIELTCIRTTSAANPWKPDYAVRGVLVRQKGGPVSFDYSSPFEDRRYAARPYYDRLFGGHDIPVENDPTVSLSVKDLRAFLAQSLPESMLPSRFEVLDRLPTTPNGKLDRKLLARSSGGRLGTGEGYVAPRTLFEEKVAAVWREVLRLERVGVKDNFFELGGHSLNALQVVGRLSGTLGLEVPVRILFLQPTVEGLAHSIEEARSTADSAEPLQGKMAALREGIRQLRAEQDASGRDARLQKQEAQLLLLESLKASRTGEAVAPLRRLPREAPLPLSFAQERLWLIDQLIPGSAVYNVPAAVRLRGPLRVDVLTRCFSEIVRRHEALRTTFAETDGSCRQVIAAPAPLALPVVDLGSLPPAEREEEARRLAVAESDRPFGLQTGPLLRATLVLLDADDQAVLFTMHHIVSDGWSTAILIREMVALYQAFVDGLPSPLPELLVQYADYAAWQRRWLTGKVLEREMDFWLARLDGLPPRLELPTDRPYPAVQTFAGEDASQPLPADLALQIRELARREGATIFMVLFAAFEALLARISGQQDFGLGTPVAGRTRPEIEDLIGFFVNTLVLRSEMAGEPTFGELIGRVRTSTLEAFDHQHLPFEALVEKLAPERNLAHSPLFQVLFAVENTPAETLEIPGLALSTLGVEESTAKFELTFSIIESAAGLTTSLQYNTDLFDASTAHRLLEHFQRLLAAAMTDPDRRLAAVPLLTAAERHQLVVEWNDTAAAPAGEPALIHRLFEEQADRTPDAVAVAFQDQRLTYRRLDELASRLAHRLRRQGVGPDVPVAISMERSLNLVVGLLGILKAGGAFAPLDPHDPEARLERLLADLGTPVVVTLSRHRPRFTSLVGAGGLSILCLDGDREEILAASAARPEVVLDRHNLAYVIFTSGSTGVPKGAMNGHEGIVNRLLWIQDAHPLDARDHVLQKTPFTFDVSIWEFFWPLLNGACLVMAEPGGHQDPAYLVRLVAEEEVTILHFVASMLRVFLEEPGVERCAAVRRVIASGEALAPSLVRQFAAHFAGELLNLYGPTEAAVEVTSWRCAADGACDLVPIGRPIANVKIRVLDPEGGPAAIGTAGELHIGGIAPARGYLGQPALTAERFVPDPFGPTPGARLYRTGDRARVLPDGAVDYLGRLDHQVKIRGFRIELGEIESALFGLAEVREAAVIVRPSQVGGGDLVAYVVAEGPAADARMLQALVTSKLPAYMVPSQFVFLEALPLTSSGKVDRRSLASIAPVQRGGAAVPQTPLQELLAGIFAEVLDIDQVSLDGNFFELGGHSLLATRVVSRLRGTLGVDLPLRALFEAPTVSRLAERVTTALQKEHGEAAPPIQRIARDGELALSFAQQRVWFIDQLEPGSPVYNLPTVLRLSGRLDVAVLALALGEIVRRHEALRSRFVTTGGRPLLAIDPPHPMALPVIDLGGLQGLEAREAEARRLAVAEALRPFDLARGPLLRTVLVRLDDEEHVALFTMHHIVSDGWSLGVLVRELGTLYTAFLAGQPSPLAELPIQYVDFASWQREWLAGDVLAAQLGFWRQRLAGSSGVLDLLSDRPRSAAPAYHGGQIAVPLGAAVMEELRGLGRREGVTLFMTLLAAFQTLLGRWTGQEDLNVGIPIAGRNRLETEGLIGFFVNTLVFRGDLAGDPDFRGLLGRVREATLSAYAHQDLPFERLVDELQPERVLTRTPLFQATLVVQNTPGGALELPGLTLSPFAAGDEGQTSKFELSLFVEEGPQPSAFFSFRRDLFDDATISRLARHLSNLLAAAAVSPATRLGALPLMDAAEEEQVLVGWNPPVQAAEERCFHELFEEQADREPWAMAVRSEEDVLTYGELELRANRLAHRLRALGVGPERPVGILAERSAEMVVGLLGILKAGGAYLPLDPELPGERLAFMLEDAGVPVLLTQSRLLDALPEHGARVVCLDDGEESSWSEERPPALATPDHLAYVIYTSGSTGRPKGVGVEHRQVSAYLAGVLERMALPPGASFATVSTIAADLGNTMIFAALATGGTLHVLSRSRLVDPEAMAEYFARHSVDCLKIVPSHLAALLAASRPEQVLPGLLLMLGGEASHWSFVDGLRQLRPGLRVLNHYGPTETTVGVATLEADVAPALRRGVTVPLGRPLPGTRLYVLDARQRPVPVGVAGELCAGGPQVSRGYLGRPDLTAERFIPAPFGQAVGERLYRTGDLVRFLPDGSLEFLGRIDLQVKVRGYRVEVGEIEAVLRAQEGVREAVVVARPTPSGGYRLIAYVVGAADPDELHRLVADSLPDYMRPSAIVPLVELPLTPNGKLDRRALPEPAETQEQAAGFVAPRNQVEKTLARIWEQVLRRERVGVYDNFFALGGDSILSIQIVSRAQQAGLGLTPKQVFEHQTIAELAQLAGSSPGAHAEQGPVTGPVPLTPIQRWFFATAPADPHHFNRSLLLTGREALNPALLERVVEELQLHHDALRLRFERQGESWSQRNDPPGPQPFHRLDLTALPEAMRTAALERAAAQVQTSLDLANGPLLRVVFCALQSGGGGERLLFVVHHLAVDELSSRILVDDLESAYGQLRRGEAVRLPAKTTSFKRWAERLAEHARAGALRSEMDDWLSTVSPWAASAPLPVDDPAGENVYGGARDLSVTLSAEETRSLVQEVPAASRAQVHEVLLAALAQAFAHWTGDGGLWVHLEGHGREALFDDADVSRTVGWFSTLYPVRLDAAVEGPPGTLLARIKDQVRGVPGHGMAFGLLRYLAGEAGDGGRLALLPPAQVSFRYLGRSESAEGGLFRPAPEWAGPSRSPRAEREHLLEIVTWIADGLLTARFTYGSAVHRSSTIESLAALFLTSLQSLVEHCRVEGGAAVAVSDFPLLDLGHTELADTLLEVEFDGFGD